MPMTAFDYFLYDNRTPSIRSAEDWGIKAATGVLADRKDLRNAFHEYCRLSHGDNKHPKDFDAAVGGLRASGRGYLLCVTLETPDRIGRDALAVVGLWCPTRDVLDTLIAEGDPIETARPILRMDRPPVRLEMRRGGDRRNRSLKAPDKTAYLRFRKGESAELALAMLDRAGSDSALPWIHGITGSSKLKDVGKKGYKVVFSSPTDATAEETLTRLVSSASILAERERELPVIVTPPRAPIVGRGLDPEEVSTTIGDPAATRGKRRPLASEALRPRTETTSAKRWMVPAVTMAGVIVMVAATALYIIKDQHDMRGDARLVDPAADTAAEAATAAENEAANGAANGAGQQAVTRRRGGNPRVDIERAITALKALDPNALRKSPGFAAAEQVEVVAEHAEDRRSVQHAYTVLLANQQHLVSPGFRTSLDYALSGDLQRALDKDTRIAQLLESAASGVDPCQTLGNAFHDELSSSKSVAHKWCEAFQSMNEAVQSLGLVDRRGS
jgi:hypothetical protein